VCTIRNKPAWPPCSHASTPETRKRRRPRRPPSRLNSPKRHRPGRRFATLNNLYLQLNVFPAQECRRGTSLFLQRAYFVGSLLESLLFGVAARDTVTLGSPPRSFWRLLYWHA